MESEVLSALISAGVAGGIVVFRDVLFRFLDLIKEKNESKNRKEDDYTSKKEQVYVGAINSLSFIKFGFDYTFENLKANDGLLDEYNEYSKINNQNMPLLKLYATDEILYTYQQMLEFRQYSFAKDDQPRLEENSKKVYGDAIITLSRLMQKDLGIRKLKSANIYKIKCPDAKCGCDHDFIDSCPKCGKNYMDTLKEILENLKKQNAKKE